MQLRTVLSMVQRLILVISVLYGERVRLVIVSAWFHPYCTDRDTFIVSLLGHLVSQGGLVLTWRSPSTPGPGRP